MAEKDIVLMKRFFVFAAIVLCLLLTQTVGAQVLSGTLADIVEHSEAAQTSKIGIYISEMKSGITIYEKNPDQPMVPSSNLKVLVAASALHYLGPDYTYKTKIYGTPIDTKRGVMESSLYLVGSGDPTFCEPYMNPISVFETFANELSRKGLRRIIGDIIGDDSAFDRQFTGRAWKERYMLDSYAAQCGGLSLNANLISITAYNGLISFFPDTTIMNIENRTVPSGYSDINVKRKVGSNNVEITGPLAPEVSAGSTITVHNPPLFATDSFAKILQSQGVYQIGTVKLIEESDKKYEYGDFVELCSHESPKLLDILKDMNKESDNLLSQHIFKTIGSEILGKGTQELSESAVKSFLKEAGVDTKGLVMADGCGLSEENKVTARQLVDLLAYMYEHKEGKNFISTLPQAGVDGTLRYRLSGDRVFAKTGTIDGCSSLAGYVWTANDNIITFAIISNEQELGPSLYKGFEDLLVDTIAHSEL